MTVLAQVHPGERDQAITVPLTAAMLSALDPRELRAQGRRAVNLSQPVSLGTDAEFDIRFLRFLREALSSLLRVEWSLATPGPVAVGDICHLPPPSASSVPPGADGADAADPAAMYANQWRQDYGFGHCCYRLGPGFVSVVDVRDEGNAARFMLDEPAVVEAFLILADAVRLDGLPPLAAELADQLTEAGLLVVLDGWATLLPHRLERWPVPCTAV
jgi:Family of unknown function (DUF5825)